MIIERLNPRTWTKRSSRLRRESTPSPIANSVLPLQQETQARAQSPLIFDGATSLCRVAPCPFKTRLPAQVSWEVAQKNSAHMFSCFPVSIFPCFHVPLAPGSKVNKPPNSPTRAHRACEALDRASGTLVTTVACGEWIHFVGPRPRKSDTRLEACTFVGERPPHPPLPRGGTRRANCTIHRIQDARHLDLPARSRPPRRAQHPGAEMGQVS